MVVEVRERNEFAAVRIRALYSAFLFFGVVRGRRVLGVVLS
jgi:hypothetical protein